MRAQRRLAVVGVLLVVVVVVLCGAVVSFVQIHATTGDWWPKAIPTTVQYNGRDYSCDPAGGHRNVTRPDLEGSRPVGHTIGGGTIYARPGATPLGVIVAGDDILRSCSLSGGP